MGRPRVVRIRADVVIRPRKPWTPTVQALLDFLHGRGLPVPKPLGYDDTHEYVRLVEGDAGDAAWPHQVELAGVRSAGALLRQVHDASADWRPPAAAEWAVAGSGPVICHGDPQPANFSWRSGQAVGLFDWDAARPAAPASDLAYALLWFLPMNADDAEIRRRGLPPAFSRRARAAALLDGYGWTEPLDVIAAAVDRRAEAIDEVVQLGKQGHEPQAEWAAAGWPERWRAELTTMRRTPL